MMRPFSIRDCQALVHKISRQALKKMQAGMDSAKPVQIIYFVQVLSSNRVTCRRVVGYEACAAVATISTDGTILRGWRLGTLVAEATENHIVARIHSATRYQSLENGLDETGAGGAGSTHCKGRSKPGAHRDPISPLCGWSERVHCRLTPARVAMNSRTRQLTMTANSLSEVERHSLRGV